ncbi:hypothetical protein DL766_002882 [Monosporascus sp. MC13-8B]|uniref:Uncharacterized protein n=1 Tax=Monosporascus cannonballus TaxID=155416 RepID=A0ABY0HBT9_9PEZI|nr:hypothetical protein DL762_004594 [Monosporascus cannonballus]RYP34663.1 hypothetical protein DL766_002882 [Monosporascus sp. MC13-8B]
MYCQMSSVVPEDRDLTWSGSHSMASEGDSWSTSYSEDAEAGDAEQETQWEHGPDDVLAVPKIEPSDDDKFNMNNIKEAPRLVSPAVNGRRNVTKQNRDKNAVVCEGYHERQIWKSGREKAEEGTRYDSTFGFPRLTRDIEQRMKQTRPLITLRPIFRGVETPEDIVFLDHYMNYVSGVLTVESEHKNAFKEMLLPMAVENGGLMHSILSMASRHIDYDAPYGKKILETHPKVSLASLLERSEFHHTAAMKKFHEDIDRERKSDGNGAEVNLSVRYGQMLCLLIQTVAEGSRSGEHRVHLEAYKHLIADNPPSDSAFLVFVTEFFQYRVFADELIHYPDMHKPRLALEDWAPWLPIEPARLIGVGDGLFKTIHPPPSSSPSPPTPLNCSIQRLAPTASKSQLVPQQQPMHTPPTDRPNSGHSTPSRADSPPPIRLPPHHDSGLTVVVEECLDIICSFKPSDPVQTLLLVPCVIIGCASFAPEQRERIRAAVRAVRGYTGLRNCELVLELLEEVWKLMDAGDWARVWDWQGVARSLGLDFSCA